MSSKLLRVTALTLTLAVSATHAWTQAATGEIRIGILNDRSGYQTDLAGEGSVVAARLAAEDFGGTVAGRKIVILSADMQNKPDVAASIARRWLDADGVDVIADNQLSSAALAVQDIAKARGKITINVSSATTDLTGARIMHSMPVNDATLHGGSILPNGRSGASCLSMYPTKATTSVDTLGHLLALHVTAADVGDRQAVARLAADIQDATGDTVSLAYVDQGYTGQVAADAAAAEGITLEVVKLPEAKRGLLVGPMLRARTRCPASQARPLSPSRC